MSALVPAAAKRSPLPSVTSAPEGLLQRCGATPCLACSGDDDTPLMRQRAFGSAESSTLPAIVREVLPASGRQLEPGVRAFFEPRFGHDFGAVRVHTDERAARAADAISASAFTVGRSIWFGRGLYQPETAFGRRLLAHELTHTIQQGGRPATQRSLRVGAASDSAEATADRTAEAVLAGESIPQIPAAAPVIRRAPKVSPVPDDPSRRIVTLDDGSRYRVKRIVDLQQSTITIPGGVAPNLTPKVDKDNVWLQVDWCSTGNKGDYQGVIKVGANLPEAAQAVLKDIGSSIIGGRDPVEALRKAEIKPFASVNITQSKKFSVDVSGGPTVQPAGGGVTGGKLQATVKIGNVELTAEAQINQPPAGSGRTGPDYQITGGIKITLGGPGKVACPEVKRTFVVPKITYQCEKIVPEHEEPKKFPVTRRQTHSFYFEYAKPEFAKRGRTAALDAKAKADLKQALDDGYRIETIRGHASPEGPVGPKKGFEGNQALSKERAEAAEKWVKGVCPPPSALSMRPSCFAESYDRPFGEGELYGTSPEGTELKGKELAESSVEAFEEKKEEAPRRTPDVMEELEKRKTAERQTDTVWPLLRRTEIVVSKQEEETRMVTVPESSEAMAKCPAEVISAVADDFDREPAVKK